MDTARHFAINPVSATTSRAKHCRAPCRSARAIRRSPLTVSTPKRSTARRSRRRARRCAAAGRIEFARRPCTSRSANRGGAHPQRTVRRGHRVAESTALAATADSARAHRFRRGPRDDGRQRRPGAADRLRRASLCRQRIDGRQVLLRRRRRAPDRAAARRVDGPHRAWHATRGAERVLRRAARREVSGRGRRAVRGYVCENYGAPLRLPELGPIGTTASRTRATSCRPSRRSRSATATSASSRSSWASCGKRKSTTPRSISSRGTAPMCRTSTT